MKINSIRAGKASLIIVAICVSLFYQPTGKIIIPLSPPNDNRNEQKSSRISESNGTFAVKPEVETAREYNTASYEKPSIGKDKDTSFDQDFLTYNELVKVKGIGDKTAKKILEYLSATKINSLDELIEVKGIGESKLKAIKEHFMNK